ncbi:MAG TPA: hypothetical protein VGP94_13985 [Tepidisphaeraceae bacterium]|jgi:hypothetical protein|nr:hypothetical protein [Tepidisphaeraceae bacterium]
MADHWRDRDKQPLDDGWAEAWIGPAVAFFFSVAIVFLGWWMK